MINRISLEEKLETILDFNSIKLSKAFKNPQQKDWKFKYVVTYKIEEEIRQLKSKSVARLIKWLFEEYNIWLKK